MHLDFYHRFHMQFKKDEFLNYGRRPKINELGGIQSIFVSGGDLKQGWFEPLDKGGLCHIQGERYPIRGIMPDDKVMVLAQFKRIIPLLGRFFKGGNEFKKTNIFQKAIILIGFTQFWRFFLEWIWWGMRDVYAEPQFYSQPTREVHRILSGIGFDKVRDIVCAIIEYDTAYRYKFQDIAGIVNKEAFAKNPIKEIRRLFDVIISREVQEGEKDRWRFMKQCVTVFLWMHPSFITTAKNIVASLEVDEVKLSIEDIYWSNTNQYYDFRGISFEKRKHEYETAKAGA